MAIEIGGGQYEIVIGTDVARPDARDGAFLEFHDLNSSHEVVMIAFRQNSNGKVTVSMYRKDVPLEVAAYFLRIAAKELSTDHWPLWNLDS